MQFFTLKTNIFKIHLLSTNLLVLLTVEADTGKGLHLDISLLQQARSQLVLLPPEFCRVNEGVLVERSDDFVAPQQGIRQGCACSVRDTEPKIIDN